VLDQQFVDRVLGDRVVHGHLADVDEDGARPHLVERPARRQPVEDDDVGLPEQAQGTHGHQLDVARAAPDEGDAAARPGRPRRGQGVPPGSTAARTGHTRTTPSGSTSTG
jgi:hypothetical protein